MAKLFETHLARPPRKGGPVRRDRERRRLRQHVRHLQKVGKLAGRGLPPDQTTGPVGGVASYVVSAAAADDDVGGTTGAGQPYRDGDGLTRPGTGVRGDCTAWRAAWGPGEPDGHVDGPARVVPQARTVPDAALGAKRERGRPLGRSAQTRQDRDRAHVEAAVARGVGRRRWRVRLPWVGLRRVAPVPRVPRLRPKPTLCACRGQGECPPVGHWRARPGRERSGRRSEEENHGSEEGSVGDGAGRGQPVAAGQGQGAPGVGVRGVGDGPAADPRAGRGCGRA